MIRTVLRKSTVRPWPSVRRPSSRICSSTSKTSLCAFSISSRRITEYGPPAHGFGQLAAFLVADVAGRRADQPRDRVPLLVLRHVEPDHRALVVEHELGQRPRQLGLADAGRAEEDERADRTVRVLQAGARPAQSVRDRLDRLVLADHALVQPLLHVDQLLGLALEQPVDRDAGPARDDGGDVVLVDLLLHHRVLELRAVALLRARVSSCGSSPWRISAARLKSPRALGAFVLHAQLVDALRDLLDAVERLLLVLPARRQLVAPLLRLGELTLDRLAHLLRLLLPSRQARSRTGARGGRPRRARPGSSRSPSAAATPPRRRGRSPCRAGSGR